MIRIRKEGARTVYFWEETFWQGRCIRPYAKNFVEKALESEMESHMYRQESAKGHKRNGKGKKTSDSDFGNFG